MRDSLLGRMVQLAGSAKKVGYEHQRVRPAEREVFDMGRSSIVWFDLVKKESWAFPSSLSTFWELLVNPSRLISRELKLIWTSQV